MKDRIRILDIIGKSKGYDTAIITTFNFDVRFFESEVLSKLHNNSIRKISLFVDERQFDKSLESKDIFNPQLGSKYVVSRVEINGAFHPKIILLLGEKEAKLIVSSANMTNSGYYFNNEIFNVIEYDETKPENQNCIKSAMDFLIDINKNSDGFDTKLISDLTKLPYYSEGINNDERIILSNINHSMIEQIEEVIDGEVQTIKIATPFFDDEVGAIKQIKEIFPSAKLSIYIQQKKSTFPVEYSDEFDIRVFESLKKTNNKKSDSNKEDNSGEKDEKKNYLTNFYHGKVFLFETNTNDYIIYGSPNCTQSGFTKSYVQGGNIECAILDKGEIGEFEIFFDNFDICEGAELKKSNFESDGDLWDKKSFKLIKATIKDGKTYCEIKNCSNRDDFKIKYHNTIIDYSVDDDVISLSINNDYNLFNLTFSFGDYEEVLKCWAIVEDEIKYFRMSEDEKSFITKEKLDQYDDDEFFELSKQLLMVEKEAQRRYKESCKRKESLDEERKTLESTGEKDVELDLKEEERALKESEISFEKEREKFINGANLFYNFKIGVSKDSDKHFTKTINTDIKRKSERIPPEIKERKINFIRNHVGQTIKAKDKYIDIECYYKMLVSFDGMFKREHLIDGQKQMLFDNDEIVINICKLLGGLIRRLKKYGEDINDEETINNAKELVIAEILENHILIGTIKDDTKRVELEGENEIILHKFDNLYNLREELDYYLKPLFKEKEDGTYRYEVFKYYDLESAKKYINELYGYKTEDELTEYVRDIIGSSASINREFNILKIEYSTDSITNEFKPNIILIKELKETARKEKTFNKVVFEIKNNNPSGKNPVIRIKHRVSLELFGGKNWDCTLYYKDGTKEEKKPQRLSFDYS